jgi:hypothetical protein
MEKPLLDFFVVLGNSRANATQLSTFRIHRVISDPEIMNGRMICTFNAVDVPIRKSGGWWFVKKLFGQQTIAGGLDLEMVRRASFNAGYVHQIKIGKPNVYLAFPDEFDDLPEAMKKDEMLNTLFKLYYMAKQSEQLRAQILSDAGIQKTEQQDILAQSVTKFNQFVTNTVKQFNEQETDDLKKRLQGGEQQQPQQPKQGYY